MTYADAWLSEMWPTVREYHAAPDVPIPSPVPVRVYSPRERCPVCGNKYVADRLADHVINAHPEALDSPVKNGLGGAA